MNKETDTPIQTRDSSHRRTRKTHQTNSTASIVLVVFLWLALAGGGGFLAKHYIDSSIQKVQQTNVASIEELNERVTTLAQAVKELNNILNNTDQTLSSSGDIQKELNAKILLLDQQLQALEKSLKTLKEAPNAGR